MTNLEQFMKEYAKLCKKTGVYIEGDYLMPVGLVGLPKDETINISYWEDEYNNWVVDNEVSNKD